MAWSPATIFVLVFSPSCSLRNQQRHAEPASSTFVHLMPPPGVMYCFPASTPALITVSSSKYALTRTQRRATSANESPLASMPMMPPLTPGR